MKTRELLLDKHFDENKRLQELQWCSARWMKDQKKNLTHRCDKNNQTSKANDKNQLKIEIIKISILLHINRILMYIIQYIQLKFDLP